MEEEVGLGVWIIGFLFFGALIVGVIFIVKFYDINFFGSNEIKAYSAMCETKVKNNLCDTPYLPGNIITYKVSHSSQRVVSETNGLVNKINKCVVKDRKSWRCTFDDNSAGFGFISGQFFWSTNWDKVKSESHKNLAEKMYYPSMPEYVDLKIKTGGGCRGYYPICYLLTVIMN